MISITRIASLSAALSLGFATILSAQSLATFGSAEVAGFGEGSALIGTSLNTGKQGWGPVATLIAQTYRYRNGLNSYGQAYAVSPSLGLQQTTPVGAVSGSLGYTFVNTEFTGVVSGNELGGTNGPFVTLQGNYWGTGENSAQVIGNYGFKSEYYWTRFRAAHRLAPAASPIYVGGEFVLQGTQKTQTFGKLTTPTQMRYQFGPTIEYRFTPEFRMGASGGYRGGNNNAAGSGYARIEFLVLTKLSGM